MFGSDFSDFGNRNLKVIQASRRQWAIGACRPKPCNSGKNKRHNHFTKGTFINLHCPLLQCLGRTQARENGLFDFFRTAALDSFTRWQVSIIPWVSWDTIVFFKHFSVASWKKIASWQTHHHAYPLGACSDFIVHAPWGHGVLVYTPRQLNSEFTPEKWMFGWEEDSPF